jgi:HK97 gp10 family phage protein
MAGGIKFEVKIEGLKELDAALKALPVNLAKKHLRTALRAGAKIVQAEAKLLAPVESGALKKSIKVRAGKRSRRGGVRIVVTTGSKDSLFKGDQWYGGPIEFGFKKVPSFRDKDGRWKSLKLKNPRAKQTKPVPGKHFLENAAKNKLREAGEIVVKQLRTLIEAEAAKTGRKTA